jgi:transcriptional regulator with XRE-family HTH domain
VKKLPNPTDKHVGKRVRMRRRMLDMSQTDLAGALGITFQQVQKYEKAANRISASRLQHIASILQVPIPFFFEGLPRYSDASKGTVDGDPPEHIYNFLATSDGLSLAKAFMRVNQLKLRRNIVQLVEEIAAYYK